MAFDVVKCSNGMETKIQGEFRSRNAAYQYVRGIIPKPEGLVIKVKISDEIPLPSGIDRTILTLMFADNSMVEYYPYLSRYPTYTHMTWNPLPKGIGWQDVRYRVIHVNGNPQYASGEIIRDNFQQIAVLGDDQSASEYVRHTLFRENDVTPHPELNGWIVKIEAVYSQAGQAIPFSTPFILVCKTENGGNSMDDYLNDLVRAYRRTHR